MKYHIKESVWAIIYNNLKKEKGTHTKNEKKLRFFYEAIWYMARSGCQWRLVPEFYGHWRSIHDRFFRWRQNGVWDRLFEATKDNPDLESVMIDGTIIRSHPCAAGYKHTMMIN